MLRILFTSNVGNMFLQAELAVVDLPKQFLILIFTVDIVIRLLILSLFIFNLQLVHSRNGFCNSSFPQFECITVVLYLDIHFPAFLNELSAYVRLDYLVLKLLLFLVVELFLLLGFLEM